MPTTGVGLFLWTWSNADRVQKMLVGLLDGLPKIGGAMERAGGTMVTLGAAIEGADGKAGARGEVDRVRALLERQQAAYAAAVEDLRHASQELAQIRVPNVHVGDQALKLPFGGDVIHLPKVETSDATPLQGVAAALDRQIAQLDALSGPLADAAQGLGNISGILASTAGDLASVGKLLQESGGELKALAG
jgi:hypothetical protein